MVIYSKPTIDKYSGKVIEEEVGRIMGAKNQNPDDVDYIDPQAALTELKDDNYYRNHEY